ncbi:ATPase [Cloacibacterium rupense]|uniref:ATPase n=1 Tax=Cloacibacterium rupense TaxID=517423 RepID=A0ABQ2NIN0_9FLAO|nr:ATP-binding protein [Cloacibacterium rupense]GGP03451.1 ATPase [Cloacibacterium rupense]
MKVKLAQAVKMFFTNSSLEMVFFEAIANAFDANASEINIRISLDEINKIDTLKFTIEDNGDGFTNERYKKFSNLFDVEESSHKGLGRLVYLCYFEKVEVESIFENKKRRFIFSENFDESISNIEETTESNGSKFLFSGCTLQKIAKREYINPAFLKNRILEEFYTLLFNKKRSKQEFRINIETLVSDKATSQILDASDIPQFYEKDIESPINLYDKFELFYSIEKTENPLESNLIAAISVDNRTYKIDLIAQENTPTGYKMVFLLLSDFFIGKVDANRQNLALTKQDLYIIQNVFRKEVAEIIEQNVPKIKKRNENIRKDLFNTYPHLGGYFNTDNVGYLKKNDVLKEAQDEFFKEQKELLEASSLNDEQFKKSLELSSRALTEYILFRQLTINKLKKSTKDNSESELHKLFATMGKDGFFSKDNQTNDIYKNNSWLLDDKYMTYEFVLSNRETTDLLKIITENENIEKDIDRPDLAFVFSNNPEENVPFDIVIVELKKRGVGKYENLKAINQLETRAQKLMKYYNNKIQRIWYYAIIEIDEETELSLLGSYNELYSTGKMFYRDTEVAISKNPIVKVPIGIYVWDLDAVVNDADSRNNTFLNFIKSKFCERY